MSLEIQQSIDNEISEVPVTILSTNDSKMYDRKRRSKAIRALTVLAYVISVSLAAIFLSIYYIFIWNGHPTLTVENDPEQNVPRAQTIVCNNITKIINYKELVADSLVKENLTKFVVKEAFLKTLGNISYSTTVDNFSSGEEAKDRLYEPKHKKKVVRVLTVVAYIFFVSLAAIMLSLYYVFIWNGHQKENMRLRTVVVPISTKCETENIETNYPQPTFEYEDATIIPTTPTEENSTWLPDLNDYNSDFYNLSKESIFIKKIFGHEILD